MYEFDYFVKNSGLNFHKPILSLLPSVYSDPVIESCYEISIYFINMERTNFL